MGSVRQTKYDSPSRQPAGSTEVGSFLRDWPGWLACLVIGMLLSAWAIHWATQHGKLTHDIQYDDVMHFADGISLFQIWQEQGRAAAVRSFASDPTLAPVSTVAAAISFGVFGVHPWAPYALNAVVLILSLLTVWSLSRGFPLAVRIAGVVWFLTVPLAWSTIIDFKPNYLSSLLVLIALFALLQWALREGHPVLLLLAAMATAGAILTKPPHFPLFGFMVVLGMAGLLILRKVVLRTTWLPAGTSWKWYLAAAAVGLILLAPYTVIAGASTIHMLREHVASDGKYQEVWTALSSGQDIWTYFLTGHGGIMLGPQFWLALLLWAAVLLGLIGGGRRYASLVVALLGFLVLAYFPPTLTAVKHRFTGLLFQQLLVLAPIYLLAVRYALGRTVRSRRSIAAWVLAIAVVSIPFMDPPRILGEGLYPPELGVEQKAIARTVLRDVTTGSASHDPPTLVLFTTGIINSTTLEWVALSEDYRIRIPPSGNMATLRKKERETRHADYLLAADEDALGTYQWHPVVQESKQIREWIKSTKEFALIREIESSGGGSFQLYQRIAPPEEATETP